MQLVRAMAEAWSGAGITANAIAPGFFPTALTGAVFEDAARVQAIQAQTAAGRVGELADLQGAAIYLCRPASNYVTGQTLYGPFTDPLRGWWFQRQITPQRSRHHASLDLHRTPRSGLA